MKKGFTLVELLAVLVLLGLILGLVFPNVVDQFGKRQKEIDDSKLKLIYSGAKSYCKENNEGFPCTVSLRTLDLENKIPFELDEDYASYQCITVTKVSDGKYSYDYSEKGC